MSNARLQWLQLDRHSRIRGLKALEELGLIELKQSGNQAYRARLLYSAGQADGVAVLPEDSLPEVPDLTEETLARLARAT